ncbi:putative hydrolase of the HAD superfamily [Rhizobium leguminosarum]|uniref:Hydrolase of the HAD superfamily n=1 Tax=Rhizobium leguminosarum TaxID=384 RepID=A0AAE2MM28_RHILE|nr:MULTISPECIES: HAD-IA family hydrolase [Rhizobium]MBB4291991.1 putative hydrolase of the HAD superfamily [Rhizobium leguminosarum]MBB4310071.1 putative hydrolase of the HAD superfamily [Rhizobium leguminosarum]MBB4419188.1 putative hydrolase of the HAD superfamily [Rhizobium leguminosarum]MBB4433991.1 putative hydrolase of the HAD superfamily [Rhizobium esperanzae]MBB4531229.1 putative hydrolase of the HAD superfamily [Rhizobium leguminosarum]
MAKFRCVLSDVHNVAIMWNPLIVSELEHEFGLPIGTIMTSAFGSEIGFAATVGRVHHEDWAAELAKNLPSELVRRWLSYLGDLNHEYITLLRSLKSSGIRVGFVTNATSRLEKEMLHHGFADAADFIVASYQIGKAKPDAEFYKFAITKAACSTDQILYIDDDPRFVSAGARAGITSIQYVGNAKIYEQLAEHGFDI